MPAEWSIRYWPPVGCHVFLSHCQEDKERLVFPVYKELADCQVISWIDRHQYPTGRDAIEALHDELLRCRHVVYFITPAALKQGRGWNVAERTLAHLAQRQLAFGGIAFQHLELPLLFVEPSHPVLMRSIWGPLVEKSVSWNRTRRARETRVGWAVREILEFLHREEQWAQDVGIRLRMDEAARQHFGREESLLHRVLADDLPPTFHRNR